MSDYLRALDVAARANLDDRGLRYYEPTKAELLADDEDADEIELVLTGLIWDASECGALSS